MDTLRAQVTKRAATNVKTKSGETYAQQLKREVDRLYDCIQDRIDEFYEQYEPKIYRRTFRLQGALYAEDIVDMRVEGNQIKLSLRFHDALSNHSNFTGSDTWIPVILNYGFHAKRLETYIGHPVPYLTNRKPALFVEKGILDWNRTNKLGITIDVTSIYNGKQFTYF